MNYYESYYYDSFVGEFSGEVTNDKLNDQQINEMNWCDEQKIENALEFGFDSFGPESILFQSTNGDNNSTHNSITSQAKKLETIREAKNEPAPADPSADEEDDDELTVDKIRKSISSLSELSNHLIANNNPGDYEDLVSLSVAEPQLKQKLDTCFDGDRIRNGYELHAEPKSILAWDKDYKQQTSLDRSWDKHSNEHSIEHSNEHTNNRSTDSQIEQIEQFADQSTLDEEARFNSFIENDHRSIIDNVSISKDSATGLERSGLVSADSSVLSDANGQSKVEIHVEEHVDEPVDSEIDQSTVSYTNLEANLSEVNVEIDREASTTLSDNEAPNYNNELKPSDTSEETVTNLSVDQPADKSSDQSVYESADQSVEEDVKSPAVAFERQTTLTKSQRKRVKPKYQFEEMPSTLDDTNVLLNADLLAELVKQQSQEQQFKSVPLTDGHPSNPIYPQNGAEKNGQPEGINCSRGSALKKASHISEAFKKISNFQAHFVSLSKLSALDLLKQLLLSNPIILLYSNFCLHFTLRLTFFILLPLPNSFQLFQRFFATCK